MHPITTLKAAALRPLELFTLLSTTTENFKTDNTRQRESKDNGLEMAGRQAFSVAEATREPGPTISTLADRCRASCAWQWPGDSRN